MHELIRRGEMSRRDRPPTLVTRLCELCSRVTVHFVDLEIDRRA